MTEKQKEMIFKLAEIYAELADECMRDEAFHDVMTENNDLYSVSLEEMSAEWYAIGNEER